jgi:hypothetical protein
MRRLLNTLYLENGELHVTIGNRRVLLAICKAKIELYEDVHYIKSLGKNRYKADAHSIQVVCSGAEFTREVDIDLLKDITEFSLLADIQRKDGIFEFLEFDNIYPVEINIDGEWRFEISPTSPILRILLNV